MRTLSYLCFTLIGGSAFAQVHVEVTAPPPPRIEVHAPPPPRIVVPPPPRVVVPPPPRVVVPPPPRIEVRAPRVVLPPPPTVRFEAPPPLVVVEPGVQVVEDADEEVFFSSGYYWHRGPEGTWWRTRNYRGGWVAAPARAVPVAVIHLPHGHYRHYHAANWHHERREIRHEIRHEVRREERQRHHGHH